MRATVVLLVLWAGCAAPVDALPGGAGASDCATCHADQHAQWSSSPHAASGRTEVFRAMLPRAEKAWGTAARDACVRCHSPMHGPDEGISCVSCHAAVGNTAEHSGRLVVDLERPLAGPFDDPVPTDAHGSRPGELLRSPSLCGTCHEVLGPGLFVEPTMTEYRESGLGRIGTGCVDCHMPEIDDAPVGPGGPTRPRRSHRFAAFEPPQLAGALALWVDTDGAAPEVVLENAAAGHAVPTGISFVRDLWVDVRITDAAGRSVERPRVLELGSVPMRGDERVALPTDADHIERRTLALGEHASAVIDVEGLTPPLEVEAVLRARPVREDVLQALDLGHLAGEPMEVERATGAVE